MLGIFDRGYWEAFRVRGIPVRVHWTTPVGALVFGGLTFSPAFWAAFFILVLVHELGHAWLVRRLSHRVLAIEVTGFGGRCRWSGAASERDRGVIAWGGVVAQGLLLVATLLFVVFFGFPDSTVGRQIASAFLFTNGLLMAVNLLPVEPLDGAEAWRFVRQEWRRLRSRGPGPPPPRPPPPRPDPGATADLARRLEQIAREARAARGR
jgi:stage IV sporulation protein FB